jgi:hypothetical protein
VNGWTVAALTLGTWALALVPVWLRWRTRRRHAAQAPLARPQHQAIDQAPQPAWRAEFTSDHVPFDGAITFGTAEEQCDTTRETPR